MPKTQKNIRRYDVADQDDGWLYTSTVKKHFFNPANVQLKEPKPNEFNGSGTVGSPVCGDVMTMWIKVDRKTQRIKKCTWRTFGCASAIASTSMLSVMVTRGKGMPIDEAEKIRPQDIIKELGGLPERKIHCSVLGDQALREAIKNYRQNQSNKK
jgi:NifU-like protein involved in Fe-S cluster formation